MCSSPLSLSLSISIKQAQQHLCVNLSYVDVLSFFVLFFTPFSSQCSLDDGHPCEFHSSRPWIGPEMQRLPFPVGDDSALDAGKMRYVGVFEAEARPSDQITEYPSSIIKRLFHQGLSSSDKQHILALSHKLYLEVPLIEARLGHLERSKIFADKNKSARAELKVIFPGYCTMSVSFVYCFLVCRTWTTPSVMKIMTGTKSYPLVVCQS